MSSNVLIIAAHPDDEVLGCGGSIARHTSSGDRVTTVFVADGTGSRGQESSNKMLATRKESAKQVAEILGMQYPRFLDFPDNRLDSIDLLNIVKSLEDVINSVAPKVIYTHHHGDLNIDHRITHQAVMTACRPLPSCSVEAIYAFEVLSSTEWSLSGSENIYDPRRFVDVSDYLEIKLRALHCYQQEMRPFPHARSYEMVEYLAKLRGGTVGLKAAEAFEVIREKVFL
jgi:N-acetylglucosamine malate deacetylase 1